MKFFFIIVVLLLCCVYASDITLNPGPWANVATAVNNAAAGDIITLTTGVYTGCSQSAVISNNITILGTLAVVQCNDDGVPFRTSGNCDGALITGITFRSAISAILHDTPCRITASNIAVSYSVAGCAVVITNGASLDIKDSTITMNNNSGICVNNGSSAYISGTVISRNNAAVNASGGGGVYVGASSSLEMTYSRVFNNTARYGGGIFVNSDDATINLYSSVLSFNVADGSEGQGGAICIFASTYSSYSNNVLMMYNMTIVSNTAAASGGGVYMDAGAITIINTTMMYNYALYGGAMAVSDGTMTVMTSYFTLNRAEYGGVMDVWSNMIVHFINCTINKNEAEDGAVLGAADASSIYMTDTYITDNHDSNYGTIYMTDATYLSMKNCTCSLNTASDGACVAGIVDDASADIYDSLFTDNYSDDISGVFDVYMAHNIMVYNCTFHRNSAYYDGGVAFIGGSLGSVNFTYCNFVNNSAVYDDGGVIVVNGATLVLWSCILDNNTSLDDGGALYTMSSATVTMYNSSIIHGYSGYWGAAICVSGSSSYKTGVLNITDSIISYNTGTYNGGAIYISSGRVAVTITRCVLNNNVALDGGGGALYAYSQTNTSSLTILQSTMSYNSALDGGALLIRYFYDTNTTNGQAILSECNITHNTAHRGGGIVIVSSMGVLIDLKITGNKATVSNAGGLWVYGNSSLSMENVEISENSSPNGAFATTDSTVRINGTGVSITRNVGCGVSVVGSLSLVLDSTSSLCRNSVSQLCGTVSSSSIGTPNICGSMTVIPPSNAYRGYLYPGMIFTIDDGSSSSHVLYDESDSVTTVQLGDESLSVVINSNSVPFAVYVPSVITTTTGPIVVHTTSGLTSVSYDDYTFIPIHIDDCVLDPSRTTGPFPSRGTTDVARLAHFELSMNCKYLPIVRCFFGDIWEHATVDLDVAHCNVPVWHDPYVMPVMLEVVLPQHFYNVSSQFEFYKGLRPTSVTPQVAHTNITNITVCGIEYYEWATPRCLYSGLYYVPASYVGSGGVRCVICEYYSPDQCSSRVTNPIQVSLYGDQACDPLFITHVCMPSVGSDVVVIPSQVIMSNEMTLISVSIAGFNFYNSPSLMCRFDNQITKGSAANSNVMMCQLPLRNDGITSTVIVQVSNDGQNWVSTSHFTFTDGLYFCEPGFENRERMLIERESCLGIQNACHVIKDECNKCGDHMTTVLPGSINATQCVCDQNAMIIIGNYSHCTCDSGYYFVNSICLPCSIGEYKESTSSSSCIKCPLSKTTENLGAKNFSQCVCAEGYYMPSGSVVNMSCAECPNGAYCRGGSYSPIARKGYYMSDASDGVFVKCQVPDACLGENSCSDGYTGYLCGDCDSDYYRKGTRCVECNSLDVILLWIAAAIVAIFTVLLFVTSYMPSKSTRFAAARIGWSFVQVTALYSQFDLKWPDEIMTVYRYLSFVILDIQIASPECSLGVRDGDDDGDGLYLAIRFLQFIYC